MYFLIPFLPLVFSLLSDEPIRGAEYEKWIEEQGLKTTTLKTTTLRTEPDQTLQSQTPVTGLLVDLDEELQSENPLINAPSILSNIHLCSHTPESGDIYGHIYCLLAYVLYIFVAATVLFFIWKTCTCKVRRTPPQGFEVEFEFCIDLRKQIPQKLHRNAKEFSFVKTWGDYGQSTNKQNTRNKSGDPSNV